ncbi:MAG: SOS response-associated peptidase [Mycobacterium sp.]
MCGRFAVTTDPARLAAQIDAIDETGGQVRGPNYNIAPTARVAAVVARHDSPDDEATRRLRLMRWGLLPPWVKAGSDGAPHVKGPQLINARAETVTTSPAFRSAAARKRCLVPMDGYYEWQRNADDPKGRKTPYYFHRADGSPLLVGGLWSVWKPDPAVATSAEPLLTFSVITTAAVGELATVHDRMPLILDGRDWDRWLDPDEAAPEDLLAGPPDISVIAIREVSTLVNRVANNGPELLEPV